MVVDTSSLVAILYEDDGEPYLRCLSAAAEPLLSAATLYEARVTLTAKRNGRFRFTHDAIDRLHELLRSSGMGIVPFDHDRAILAHRAYLRFGRGFHPAGLNLIDCAAYALATSRDLPLL